MFERFSAAAREVVVEAQRQAALRGDGEITAAHLAYALCESDDPVARILAQHGVVAPPVPEPAAEGSAAAFDGDDAEVLRSLGIDLDQVRRAAEQTFGPGALDVPSPSQRGERGGAADAAALRHVRFTREAKSVLEGTLREALGQGDRTLRPAHLVLAMQFLQRPTEVAAVVDPVRLTAELRALLTEQRRNDPPAGSWWPFGGRSRPA